LGEILAIETTENWSKQTLSWLRFSFLPGLLPVKRTAVLVDEYDQLCCILGKYIATAKAARKAGPGETSAQPLPIANDQFAMTISPKM
jgi:hypothetical protein